MTTYTVRLEDDTVGTLDSRALDGKNADTLLGQTVRIRLQDENGNPIEAQGKLAEVLESREDWQ